MTTLRILSAGAAQAVVEKIAERYTRDTGHEVQADFSAVGAMKARVVNGEPVDAIVLTGALIDELIATGHVVPGTRADLGKVGTGVAARAGTSALDVSSSLLLRDVLLNATKIVCPDPAVATAGKVVMQVLDRLGISGQVKPSLQYFPNGYAAMKWLTESRGRNEIGITQITEILANKGVTYVGPLPGDLQAKTVYAAGLAARAAEPAASREFIARLTSAKEVLSTAGYELD